MTLTPEQRRVLLTTLRVLDEQAGQGHGVTLHSGDTIWMDELVGEIYDAFALEDLQDAEKKLYD